MLSSAVGAGLNSREGKLEGRLNRPRIRYMYCILFFDPHLCPVLFMTVPCDDHFAVFLKSLPSGVPLLASLVADHPKSPISGGLEYFILKGIFLGID